MTTTEKGLYPTEFWTVTAGDLAQKRDHLATPKPETTPGDAAKIVIDPADRHQEWIGAGAAITDAAASLIWKQSKEHAVPCYMKCLTQKKVISRPSVFH